MGRGAQFGSAQFCPEPKTCSSKTCSRMGQQTAAFQGTAPATSNPPGVTVIASIFLQYVEASSTGSCACSVGLAAQEGRDIDDFLLDEIANRGGAAALIETSRRRGAGIVRSRPCQSNFGV